MQPNLPEEPNHTGVMMLRIDGFWSVREFRELLASTEDVYNRVAKTTLLGDFVREENRRNRGSERKSEADWSWSALYYGGERFRSPNVAEFRQEPWEAVLLVVQPFVVSLGVGAIRLESPGWVNLLGHLNPLKTIADFISKWRAEDTKRMKIGIDAGFERDRLTLEREKMNRQFAIDILAHMPEGEYGAARRFAEIAEHTISPSIAALGRLVSDSRVVDAELVETSSSRPPDAPTIRKPRLS